MVLRARRHSRSLFRIGNRECVATRHECQALVEGPKLRVDPFRMEQIPGESSVLDWTFPQIGTHSQKAL